MSLTGLHMLAFLNALSPMHVVLVLVVALLLFGNRLPEVARSIGRAINEFKKGMKEVGDNVDDDKAEKPRLTGDEARREDAPAEREKQAENVRDHK